MRLGYEQQTYINFNQAQYRSFVFTSQQSSNQAFANTSNSGDLSMRGLVAGLKFFF
jgi:hypothetical protein